MNEFDYVVVGGGSAGCIVAARLSERGTVCVLEAGPHASQAPATLRADGYKDAFLDPRLMYERFSTTDPRWGDRRVFLGTGRVLGGSGAVNAMVYTRGARQDFASWPEGWRWDDVAGDFDAVEATLRPRPRAHTEWTERCVAAAEQAGLRRSRNLSDGDYDGVLGYEPMNYEGDDRRSSYVGFLAPAMADPARTIELTTGALVDAVVFEGTRAVGVRYRLGSEVREVRARREVVLCAGALATPAILQRSGVGAADALQALGVEVVLDQPGVGENLHDHPNVQLFFKAQHDVDCDYPQLYGFERVGRVALAEEGPDTCFVFYPARSSFREGLLKLLPNIALPPALYEQPMFPAAIRKTIEKAFEVDAVRQFVAQLWGIVVVLGKPESRGHVRIRSSDPAAMPEVDPGYFAEPADMECVLAGIERAREIAGQPALNYFGAKEVLPGPLGGGTRRRALERFVRKNVMTTYHFAGTCRMGEVVDADCRVRGLEGLRVIDASVMPVAPVAALNAPTMMLAHRAAGRIG